MLLNSLTLHLQIILITDQKNVSLLTSIFLSTRVTKKKKVEKVSLHQYHSYLMFAEEVASAHLPQMSCRKEWSSLQNQQESLGMSPLWHRWNMVSN